MCDHNNPLTEIHTNFNEMLVKQAHNAVKNTAINLQHNAKA